MLHTKKLCPVASRNTHEFLLSARMEIQVRRDIVDLAIERRPRIITFIVQAQYRRGYACQGRRTTLNIASKLSSADRKQKRTLPAGPCPSSSARPSQAGCARAQERPLLVSWIWTVASAVSLSKGEASETRTRTARVDRVFSDEMLGWMAGASGSMPGHGRRSAGRSRWRGKRGVRRRRRRRHRGSEKRRKDS
jgi:hypothetical protein